MQLLVNSLRQIMRTELGLQSAIAAVTTPERSAVLAETFAEAVRRHRVVHVVAPHSRALGLAAEVEHRLGEMERASTFAAMSAAADAVFVSKALSDSDCKHLLLKGVALAVQTTGSPLARGSGDVDLLVDPADVPRAVEILTAVGIELDRSRWPPMDSPLSTASLRPRKELTLFRGDREVDLHWRLDVSSRSLNWPFEELHGAAEWIELGGASVPTLSRRHAVLFNAAHGANDSWSLLRAVVDDLRLRRGVSQQQITREAAAVGAARREEIARAIGGLLVDDEAPDGVSGASVGLAQVMWGQLQRGRQPRYEAGPAVLARRFAMGAATYDEALASSQFLFRKLGWPAKPTAEQSLGQLGERRPWLYSVASPYYRSRRLAELVTGTHDEDRRHTLFTDL